jgi:hypothetical protein
MGNNFHKLGVCCESTILRSSCYQNAEIFFLYRKATVLLITLSSERSRDDFRVFCVTSRRRVIHPSE